MSEDLRLGVFICECGEKIGSNLDLEALTAQVQESTGATLVRRLRYGCFPDGLETIRSAIEANEVDRVLVAGCTPRTLGPRFLAACAQSGLSDHHFKLVDIREGCAWTHRNEVESATLKAADLILMGAEELRLRKSYASATVETVASALVIGGGIAGTTAVRIMADEGIHTKWVERESALLHDTVNSMDEQAVLEHPNIEVLPSTEIAAVSGGAGRYMVTLRGVDRDADGTRDFEVGAIVIATNAPRDIDVLAYGLGIPQDLDHRLPSARFRLRPGRYIDRGIYVCGPSHRMTDGPQAEFQGAYAALCALNYLVAGTHINKAPAAVVDQRLCTGCATCITACPLKAISIQQGPGVLSVAEIDAAFCSACGNCVVACPSKAIELPLSSDEAWFAQIEAALPSRSMNGDPRVLVFGCEWSGQIAAEIAGARRMAYPTSIRPIAVDCSARFDPTFALWAFHRGADGVMLTACHPGRCHFEGANRNAEKRIETLRGQLAETGFDVRRLQLEWVQPDDPETYVDKLSRFSELISQLPPRRTLVA